MVFYYEQNQPMYYALLVFARTKTIFGMVAIRFEFWFFLFVHVAGVVLFKMNILTTGEFDKFRWEAVSATQMFMVFLLTFFNGHCFTRYLYLYDLCMEVLDGTLFFVQEVIVSLSSPRVERHRVRAVKYVLAMMHIFFVGITGGMKTKTEWREVVRRGLLSKLEAEQLQCYPSHCVEAVLVLATWTMQIIDKALEDDAFWDFRSMRIAHTHNRLQNHMNTILSSVHEIGDVLALPIPYPYYHVMNLVLIFNLLILCVICASFSTYQTVFPFCVSVMFFLGLREVSANLAEPFNGEDSDFPIDTFLQYAFDTCICLLEAFRHGNAEEFVSRLLDGTSEFTNEQLRHKIPSHVIYTKNYDASVSSPFSWNREMPLLSLASHSKGPLVAMKVNQMAPSKEQSDQIAAAKNVERIDLGAEKRVEETDDVVTIPFSIRCKKCLVRVSLVCCPRRANLFKINDPDAIPADVLKVETQLQKSKEVSRELNEKLDEWNLRLATQQAMLDHRIQVGRERGYLVDELLGFKKAAPVEVKSRRGVPEFASFAEAGILIENAKKSQHMEALTWITPDTEERKEHRNSRVHMHFMETYSLGNSTQAGDRGRESPLSRKSTRRPTFNNNEMVYSPQGTVTSARPPRRL